MGSLTGILLNRAFNTSDGSESNMQERKEGKRGRKKLSILVFLYNRLEQLKCRVSQISTNCSARALPLKPAATMRIFNLGEPKTGIRKEKETDQETDQEKTRDRPRIRPRINKKQTRKHNLA